MTRDQAFLDTLQAMAKMQHNISLILGAKAVEAEKVRSWVIEHLKTGTLESHADRLGTSLQIHEQQIEMIDGLAKLCNGLSRNMKVVLHPADLQNPQDDDVP